MPYSANTTPEMDPAITIATVLARAHLMAQLEALDTGELVPVLERKDGTVMRFKLAEKSPGSVARIEARYMEQMKARIAEYQRFYAGIKDLLDGVASLPDKIEQALKNGASPAAIMAGIREASAPLRVIPRDEPGEVKLVTLTHADGTTSSAPMGGRPNG